MRVADLKPAYILHSRAYRDTSLILECLVKDFGKVSILAKGARAAKSKFRGILQQFVPLLVNWSGNTNLFVLNQAEAAKQALQLSATRLLSGLYVNELLVKLLPYGDNCANTYTDYENVLYNLHDQEKNIEVALRIFETRLLNNLGYKLQLQREVNTGEQVEPHKYYMFDPQLGPIAINTSHDEQLNIFLGKHLLEIAAENYQHIDTLVAAKRLMRFAIQTHLGDKHLQVRRLV